MADEKDATPTETVVATPLVDGGHTPEPVKDVKPEEGGEKDPRELEADDEKGWSDGTRKRFDGLNTRMKTAEGRVPELEKELANLQGQVTAMGEKAPTKEKGAKSDFIDSMEGKDKDTLMNEIEDDPAGFFKSFEAALTKRISDSNSATSTAKDYDTRASENLETFAKEHEDFDGLWDSKKIPNYMKKNPGFDAVGAYYALTKESRAKASKALIEKTEKETREKVLKEIATGKNAGSLSGGPSAMPGTSSKVPDYIKDPKAHGLTKGEAGAKSLVEYREARSG